MNVARLADGLWRWTAPHPRWNADAGADGSGWPRDVGCVYWEPPCGGVVLVDPLVPDEPADRERFWKALDRDVACRGGEVVVLVTVAWHGRSADAIRMRYASAPSCSVLAHEDAAPRVQATLTGTFGGTLAELTGGLRARRIAAADGGEVILELPADAGLVVADVLLGHAGGLRTCPSHWMPAASRPGFQERLRSELRPLLKLRASRILVSHGEPVVADARQALQEALEAPPLGG